MSVLKWGLLGAVLLAFAGTPASAATVFGAKLNHQLTPPEVCNNSQKSDLCSWVMTQAQKNAGKERAPHDGTIVKIRLFACAPGGTFVFQTYRGKTSNNKFKAVRSGPLINYNGTKRNCTASKNFDIEEFSVNVPVKKGDFIGVVASRVAFIYNSSGDGSTVFDPPLADGAAARTTNGTGLGDGFLMMQVEMNP